MHEPRGADEVPPAHAAVMRPRITALSVWSLHLFDEIGWTRRRLTGPTHSDAVAAELLGFVECDIGFGEPGIAALGHRGNGRDAQADGGLDRTSRGLDDRALDDPPDPLRRLAGLFGL